MPLVTESDETLLQAWCDGDAGAGEELLRRAFPRLYRFFFNKVGDDVGELVQQTLTACVEHRDKLSAAVSFEAYLLSMARNKLYDHLRRRGRSRELVGDSMPSVRDLGTSIVSLMGRQAREAAVLRALQALPVDLQVVIELHYWSELTTREIADVIEVPVGTVKSRLRRAREHFEVLLREEGAVGDSEVLSTVRP